jgi:hypothetical protein
VLVHLGTNRVAVAKQLCHPNAFWPLTERGKTSGVIGARLTKLGNTRCSSGQVLGISKVLGVNRPLVRVIGIFPLFARP